MTDDPAEWWDEAYEGDPPWENGRPQPALVELVAAGELDGRVLDAGCGAGTHACYLAERGRSVVGVDVSERAIERARRTARERGLDATFRVGDALDLDPDLGPFDAAFDCGLFHALDSGQRDAYAESLAGVLPPGGRAFVLSFAEGAPDDWGPDPVADADVREAFADGWRVRDLRDVRFETNDTAVPGSLAVLRRA